jgi:hypothetical protein
MRTPVFLDKFFPGKTQRENQFFKFVNFIIAAENIEISYR